MRIATRVALAGALVAGLAGVAAALDVPLTYHTPPKPVKGVPKVASIQVAEFDMLAPGAKPAPVRIELGEKITITGPAVLDDTLASAGIVEGRECRWNPAGLGLGTLRVDNRVLSSTAAAADLFVLLDYFDGPPDGVSLTARYRAFSDPGKTRYGNEDGPPLTGSNTWKRHQIKLPNVAFTSADAANPELARMPGKVAVIYCYGYRKGEFGPFGYQQPESMTTAPATAKLPALVAKDPLIRMVKVGDKSRLIVADQKTAASGFYDRVYFDSNGNGDLTDDGVCDADRVTTSTDYKSASFPAIATTVVVDGKEYPYAFKPNVSSYKSVQTFFRSAGHFADGDIPIQSGCPDRLPLRGRVRDGWEEVQSCPE